MEGGRRDGGRREGAEGGRRRDGGSREGAEGGKGRLGEMVHTLQDRYNGVKFDNIIFRCLKICKKFNNNFTFCMCYT